MRTLRSSLAALVFVASVACHTSDSPKTIAAKLAAAHTAQEEADVFHRLRHRRHLGFAPFDAEGKLVDMTQQEWWERTQRIVITLDDEQIPHVLIDKKNVFVLMAE